MGGHFDTITSSYTHSMEALAPIYRQAAIVLDPLVRDRTVLDVGSGGTFTYDVDLPAKVVALDISTNMLAQIQNPRIEIVADDARTMRKIADDSVDVVMFCLVLHHINDVSSKKTLELLTATLDVAARKLRAGGHLAILEVLAPAVLYPFEAALFPVMRGFLRSQSRDMIFLFTQAQISRRVERLLGTAVTVHRIDLPAWYDPLAGSFPGVVRIPGALSPTPFRLFIAQK